MDLSELRGEIDAIDAELVKLFCARMEISAKVADYKKANNLPIHHPLREKEILQRISATAGADMESYVRSLYAVIFELSRSYQRTRSEVSE